jgi:hypothetical protein
MKKLIKKCIVVFLLFNNSLLIIASQANQNYPSKLSYKKGKLISNSDGKATYEPSDPKDSWSQAIVCENGSVRYQVSAGELTYFPNGSLEFTFKD